MISSGLIKSLIIIMPFYVVLKVFFEFKLGVNFFGIFKELVIIALFVSVVWEYIKRSILPRFDILDYLIFGYIGYGVIISLIAGEGIRAVIYGGRYDFEFLVLFMIVRHSAQFLGGKFADYMRLFLWSAGISLAIGVIIKFLVGEEVLTYVGFSPYVTDWQFFGSIPMYHGVEASGLRRFQGLLDGPNQMAYFIVVFLSVFLHYFRKKFDFSMGIVVFLLFFMLILTYSRSAILGIFTALGLVFILDIKNIFTNYKSYFLPAVLLIIFVFGGFFIAFEDKIDKLVLRSQSTTHHFVRMEIGVDRFLEAPMGSGLGSSGPGYRQVYTDKDSLADEKYFIPESWFIQQLVEGGVIYFILFLSIIYSISRRLFDSSKAFFLGFVSVVVMNMFLHIFEATYISILFFIFLGFVLKTKEEDIKLEKKG